MDSRTLDYYRHAAREVAAGYASIASPVSPLIKEVLSPNARVLDVGFGSGRDMHALREAGYDVYGVEPVEELRAEALSRYPELSGRIAHGTLPDIGEPFGGQFDGVVCSAVIVHLARPAIFDAIFALRQVLKSGGVLFLSVPVGRPGLDSERRDDYGRLFTRLEPDYLKLLLERVGFALIREWTTSDAMGRREVTWYSGAFQFMRNSGLRPIDQVEGILTRDRKTATYKLALFRALAEIATTSLEVADWRGGGVVGVPLRQVAELWLFYYWPLVANERFIPQIRGESEKSAMPIAFRAHLGRIVANYKRSGGISAFAADYRNRQLSADTDRACTELLSKIEATIVKGPVTYAGGALQTGVVFRYDSAAREILVGADVWRELTLLGHWIRDAVILRWAELTAEISKGEVKASDVIELLISTPIPEREVQQARAIFSSMDDRICTWTETRLGSRFDVDHIIPFSLWHNNDLWNLVPALPTVNGSKSDRLPTRALLNRQADRIALYWQALRKAYPNRFVHEAAKLAGSSLSDQRWERAMLHAVIEAVEVTALQRGCQRWEPIFGSG